LKKIIKETVTLVISNKFHKVDTKGACFSQSKGLIF